MPEIKLLSQETIDKIAAGEVVERPASVVKELVENAIDAGASAITIEIKEGGIAFIRITDNGCGIEKNQVRTAFLRHSTSKIRGVEDLVSVRSLGFRGEALSSISAIARVELITKTQGALTGVRYVMEGAKELSFEEIGAPDGTTFLIRDLFYNTPARRKFLKSPQTEGNYITDLIERLALSHPNISFKYIQNNHTKLHTSGNGNVKDVIYHIFGRDITSAILPLEYSCECFKVHGFIGKPSVSRGNRNYENYYINGRYIKSSLLAKAIEEAYKPFMMQHQYPFTILYFEFPSQALDVNVHPTKMELRFDGGEKIYTELVKGLSEVLHKREMIREVPVTEEKHEFKREVTAVKSPEPFETRRLNDIKASVAIQSPYAVQYPNRARAKDGAVIRENGIDTLKNTMGDEIVDHSRKTSVPIYSAFKKEPIAEDMTLADLNTEFLSEQGRAKHRMIGQVFETYWLIEMEDKLYIIDQHAAHEKVLYERMMKQLKTKEFTSQKVNPPIVVSLDAKETQAYIQCREQLETLGYEIEAFGGKEYLISAIPDNLYHLDMKELFVEILDEFSEEVKNQTPDIILEKVASMSCKAAVKGNNRLSVQEANALIDELMSLENPYNCPHGRPTIISMTKYELEKKFKRIV